LEIFARSDAASEGLSALCFEAPQEELTATENAQPAILTTSIAILAAALEGGSVTLRPAFVAGHSLGQYSALVTAGALTFVDALVLVKERGRLMSEAGTQKGGTMAAIVSLDETTVESICADSGAEVANYNAPTQIVVGGTPKVVEKACALAKERGGRGLPVNVSGAFHTSLMSGAAEQFAPFIEQADLHDPLIPVIGNVSAQPMNTATEIRADLLAQVRSPVRWYQSVDFLADAGVTRITEIGPGRILTGQLKRSHPTIELSNIDEAAVVGNTARV
jgi:[acyl-carrier-protein] S-malonyltransferase